MSLYRQLWIAIALLMLLVFGTTFLINGFGTSRYLGERLSIKNSDDASALALSLSQQQLDRVDLELQLAAQLDHGSYTLVRFVDPDGQVLFERAREFQAQAAPAFLRVLFPISAEPGTAAVTDGWTQLGSLTLKSHNGYAYDELWTMGKNTLLALVLAILLAGATGSWILRLILRPLDDVVRQAQALGERRFEKHGEAGSLELAVVTRAMNALTDRVQAMLRDEAQRLGAQRERLEADPVTGMLSREPFLERMDGKLTGETAESAGSIAIIRVENLMELNRSLGRHVVDTVLGDIGTNLQTWVRERPALLLGRLNGSDIAVMAPGDVESQYLGDTLRRLVADALAQHALSEQTSLPAACGHYAAGDSPSTLLASLDQTMSFDGGDSDHPVSAVQAGLPGSASHREHAEAWKRRLDAALAEQRLSLEYYPVVDASGAALQDEGMLRLEHEGDRFTGGQVLPWAHRLGLAGAVDRAVLGLALQQCRRGDNPVCINISAAALTDRSFTEFLRERLLAAGSAAGRLHMDVTEAAAYDNAELFGELRRIAHARDAKLGIEHMGYRVADLGLIGKLGPDYLKIDRAFVHGIDVNSARRALLTTYASIARNLGIGCIAEGVASDAEREAAFACGTSGVTGPGVRLG